ncbi:MAG: hypothetical protein ACOCTT_00620 [archaeon]
MPLMNKIMKKYEQEAQEKILEAQQMKKEKKEEEYAGKDHAEILNDPYADKNEEEAIKTEIGDSKSRIIQESNIEENQGNEEVIETRNEIEKLCESLKKANEVLEGLKEKTHILERVKEFETNNNGDINSPKAQKIEI